VQDVITNWVEQVLGAHRPTEAWESQRRRQRSGQRIRIVESRGARFVLKEVAVAQSGGPSSTPTTTGSPRSEAGHPAWSPPTRRCGRCC